MISHFTLSDWDIEMAYSNLRDKMTERDENQIKREMRNAIGGGGGVLAEEKRYYRARNRWTNWWFSGLHHWVMPSVRTEVLSHNLIWELNAQQQKKTPANTQNTSRLGKHLHQSDNACAEFRKTLQIQNTANTKTLQVAQMTAETVEIVSGDSWDMFVVARGWLFVSGVGKCAKGA